MLTEGQTDTVSLRFFDSFFAQNSGVFSIKTTKMNTTCFDYLEQIRSNLVSLSEAKQVATVALAESFRPFE